MSSEDQEIKVFISHRIEDLEIGEEIFDSLVRLGVDEKKIFFSSKTDAGRPSVGEFVTTSIAKGLNECDLFILVFTIADEDWQWCM